MKKNIFKHLIQLLFVILLSVSLTSCSNPFKDIDWSTPQEPDGKKRARANAEAGQGLGSGNIFGGKKSVFFTTKTLQLVYPTPRAGTI